MPRRAGDEYQALAALLVEFAELGPDEPRRPLLRDRLVAGYLPVARHIAQRYARRGEPLDDLEQVASIGLMHALERFDPARGRDFLSYAVPTITGEVRRHFRDATWTVRAPRSLKERYLAVGAATTSLSLRLGRAPTVGELAEHLDLDRDEVVEAVAAGGSYQPASLDAALGDGSDASPEAALIDKLAVGDDGLERAEQRATLHTLVAGLPERERTILVLRFVHDRTQAEIGAALCISQMHVSRLLSRTVALLRDRATGTGADDGAPRHRSPVAMS